jgi:hypothetical protein
MNPSQRRYLQTGQHKQNKTHINIHALSGIRTHDLSDEREKKVQGRAATVACTDFIYIYTLQHIVQ